MKGVFLKIQKGEIGMGVYLKSALDTVKAVPEVLERFFTPDNIPRIGLIVINSLMEINEQGKAVFKSHGTLIQACSCIAQVVEFSYIFRLPALWLNRVTQESIICSDHTVNKIKDILKRPDNKPNPGLTGSGIHINNLRNLDAELDKHIREALDSLLENNRGYTKEGFRKALEDKLSFKISTAGSKKKDVQVHLTDLDINSILKPTTWLETALLVAKSCTYILHNIVLLQYWNIWNFIPDSLRIFAKDSRTGFPVYTNLLSIGYIAIYVLMTLDSLNRYTILANEDKTHQHRHNQITKIENSSKMKYLIANIFSSIANGVLSTFIAFDIPHQAKFKAICLFKGFELINEAVIKPKLPKFCLTSA